MLTMTKILNDDNIPNGNIDGIDDGWQNRLARGLCAEGPKFDALDLTSLLRLLSVLCSLNSFKYP